MDDKFEVDTLNDGPEAERWRIMVEKLTREGERVATAVALADLVARVRREHPSEPPAARRPG